MTVFPAGFGLTANLTGSSNCTPHLQKHSGDRSSSPLAGNITWAVRGHQTRVPEVQSNIPKAQRRGKDSGDDAGQGVLRCRKRVSACPVVALRVTAPRSRFPRRSRGAAAGSCKSKLGSMLCRWRGNSVSLVLANPLLWHKAARTEHCAERGETENTRGTAISPERRVV